MKTAFATVENDAFTACASVATGMSITTMQGEDTALSLEAKPLIGKTSRRISNGLCKISLSQMFSPEVSGPQIYHLLLATG